MALQGKGFMIWQVARCEGGNAAEIARVARAANLTHVLIKIADGPYTYNVDKNTKKDLVPAVVQELHNNGMQAWGWHYIYGYNPVGEAQIAVKRVRELGLDGYCIDAEGEYKQPGRDVAARTYMTELRKSLANTPIGLCSYRFPVLHPQLPWKEFLDKCDYNMPQVYWQAAHNAGDQLRRCVREFQAMTPFRPILPVGPVYRYGDWVPTATDIIEYLQTCVALNLSATSFFEWYYGRTTMQSQWNSIAQFPWPGQVVTKDLPERYIDALNTRNAAKVVELFKSDAVHITASETIQGTGPIQTWFTNFLTKTLPSATFKLTGVSGVGTTRHFTWTATATTGKVQNGSDTFGTIDGKIAYHYSYFTVTK